MGLLSNDDRALGAAENGRDKTTARARLTAPTRADGVSRHLTCVRVRMMSIRSSAGGTDAIFLKLYTTMVPLASLLAKRARAKRGIGAVSQRQQAQIPFASGASGPDQHLTDRAAWSSLHTKQRWKTQHTSLD